MRLRLDLAYDGTAYSGWARQHGQTGVAQVLEEALATVLRLPEPPRTVVAGRTDAGVHARGQVVHLDIPREAWDAVVGRTGATSARALLRRLSGVLPPDVRVRAAQEAPEGFDARFSPEWRRYAYRVADDPARVDPLRRTEVLVHPRSLDVRPMQEAAQTLLGLRDFAAFCRRREGATTVRTLLRLDVVRQDEDGLVVATVVADAFCHSMVRALVGALMAVGDGSQPARWPADVLGIGRRDPRVTVAPARGLTLEEVRYPSVGLLAGRAQATRRVRREASPASAPEHGPRAVLTPPGPPR